MKSEWDLLKELVTAKKESVQRIRTKFEGILDTETENRLYAIADLYDQMIKHLTNKLTG